MPQEGKRKRGDVVECQWCQWVPHWSRHSVSPYRGSHSVTDKGVYSGYWYYYFYSVYY